MKRALTILLLLTSLFVSCSENNDEVLDEFTPNSVLIVGRGSPVSVSFKTNMPWKAVATEEWCRIHPDSGDGGINRTHVVSITCDGNYGKDIRECVVRFTFGQTVKEVAVKQDYTEGLYLDVFEYEVGAEAGECIVDLWKGDIDITVEIPQNAGWIKYVSTKSMTPGSIVLSISENMGSARSATLTLSGGEKTGTIVIRQKASSIRIPDPVLCDYIKRSFDKDYDGNVSKKEASEVYNLYISEEVQDVTGVEYFNNVMGINLKSKYLHSFNFELFPKLKEIDVSSPIDTLDFTHLPYIQWISLSGVHKSLVTGPAEALYYMVLQGSYESIQLSSLPSLSNLVLGSSFSGPETVDLSSITGIFTLVFNCHCSSSFILENSKIGSIVTSNTSPITEQQFMKKLILKNCPNLHTVRFIHDNGMEELICSGNPQLQELYYYGRKRSLNKVEVTDCSSLNMISIQGANLETFLLDRLPALTWLLCTDCGLKNLDLTGVPSIQQVNCTNNPDLAFVYCKIMPPSIMYDQDVTTICLL